MSQRFAHPAWCHIEFHQNSFADGRKRAGILRSTDTHTHQHNVGFTQVQLDPGHQRKFNSILPIHFSYRFTQIVVDAQIKTPGGKTYDVIFVGTGESIYIFQWSVIKLISKQRNTSREMAELSRAMNNSWNEWQFIFLAWRFISIESV